MSLTNQVQKEQHSSSKQRQECIMYNKVQVQATSKSIRETYYLKLRHIFLHIDNMDGACLVTDTDSYKTNTSRHFELMTS